MNKNIDYYKNNNNNQKEIIFMKISGKTVNGPNIEKIIDTIVYAVNKLNTKIIFGHGAGPQLNEFIGEKKLDSNGERITEPQHMKDISIIDRLISIDLIKKLESNRIKTGFLPNGILPAKKRSEKNASGSVELLKIPENFETILQNKDVVVVGHTGINENYERVNINADMVALNLALHFRASLFMFGTTNGILDKNHNTIPTINNEEYVDHLIQENIINAGMIPKIKSLMDFSKKSGNSAYLLSENQSPQMLDILSGKNNKNYKITEISI